MLGAFGAAVEARQIDAGNGRLTADVTGEIEIEEGVLVIRRIDVKGLPGIDDQHPRNARPRWSECKSHRSTWSRRVWQQHRRRRLVGHDGEVSRLWWPAR